MKNNGSLAQPVSWPRISIVTPSYNQGGFIEDTIRSVLLQDYPNLEFIIMDGGSRDNTVEVIKKYAGRIDYWVSEKDRGQSHAINKGLARCTGEIFNWINSDDLLLPDALWAVAEAWVRQPGSIIAGHTELFDENGPLEVVRASGQTLKNFVRFWEAEDFGWTQQGTFMAVKDARAVNGVREDLTYCMDYDLMVKLLRRGGSVVYLDRVLSRFRCHPLSKTVGARKDFRLERVNALQAIKDLPVKVETWEWEAEKARRLVDMARHAWRGGFRAQAASLLGRSLTTSPTGAMSEVERRFKAWIKRGRSRKAAPRPTAKTSIK
jgi:glycosyltransferase involved in cell wall biosynthesis